VSQISKQIRLKQIISDWDSENARPYWGKEGPETEGFDGRGLWWRDVVKDFAVLDLEKEDAAPEGAVMGVKCQTICLMSRSTSYLMGRVREAWYQSHSICVDVSNGLEGVVQDVKRIATGATMQFKIPMLSRW